VRKEKTPIKISRLLGEGADNEADLPVLLELCNTGYVKFSNKYLLDEYFL
jgi:hypothetical protein